MQNYAKGGLLNVTSSPATPGLPTSDGLLIWEMYSLTSDKVLARPHGRYSYPAKDSELSGLFFVGILASLMPTTRNLKTIQTIEPLTHTITVASRSGYDSSA